MRFMRGTVLILSKETPVICRFISAVIAGRSTALIMDPEGALHIGRYKTDLQFFSLC